MRRFLVPVGVIDGVNQTFTLPSGFTYVSGSLLIVVGGLTIPADHDNGAIEVDSSTFTTKEILQVGDALLCIIDDGTSSGVSGGGVEIDLTMDPTNYSLDFNSNNYSIEFNTNSIKLGS